MRVHLLALPNAPTTEAYGLDGFAQMTRRFAALLIRLGHTVYLYGAEGNDAPCTEFVQVLTDAERRGFLGETPYQSVPFEPGSQLFLTFNTRVCAEVQIRKTPADVIALLGGQAQQQVWTQHQELKCCEYSIGYQGVCAPFRVYQSHVWRHVVHGFTGMLSGRELDGVIPPFFDVAEFPFVGTPEPYVVYCGRLVPRKGIATACQAAAHAGVPLKLMGFGDESLITYGELVGTPTGMARNQVLANATACLMPTQYLEPFGNVAAEAQLCGTPVITTDYGAFVESVEHGMSGYRCSTLGEFVQAIHAAKDLDRAAIRARAIAKYSMEAAERSYRAYFSRLMDVDGASRLTPTPDFLPMQEAYGSLAVQC